MDGSEVVSSLQSFKPKHESVNVNELKGTLQDVEATFQKDTAARRAMRSKLERSASSVRRERSELQNMIDFRVQQAAIEEEKKYLDLNRRVDAMVKSQEKQEEQEVKYDDEEKVVYEGGDDELLFDKEESEEESKPAPSITVLSDDEDVPPQPSVKVVPAVEKATPVEKESELLVMNKEGKLEKAKPKKSVIDMFQRAKEKKREEEIKKKDEEKKKEEEKNKEIEEQNETEEEEEETEEQNNLVNNDENTYSPQEQPTAEDYERYKRMMRDEDHRKSNRLFDDEAEESGSDVNPDDDDDDDEKMAVPEGIDIIERPSESVCVL